MLQRGSLIIDSEPFVHVLMQKQRNKRCDECFQESLDPGKKLLRCSSCKFVRYCNTNCQRKAWQLHKSECRCLKRVSPRFPTDAARLFYLLCIRWKNGDHISVKENGRSFSQFMSHEEEIKQSTEKIEEFQKLCHTMLAYVGGDSEALPSLTDQMSIYGKMVVNSFSICDQEMQAIGSGVYLKASRLDHRCCMNAVVTFRGTKLQLRLLEDFPKEKAANLDEVYISYIDQLQPLHERQKALQQQYFFTCQCDMCLDQNLNNSMLALKCPSVSCKEPVNLIAEDLVCPSCGPVQSDHVDTGAACVQHWQDTVDMLDKAVSDQDWVQILCQCKSWLNSWEPVLHEDNIYLRRVQDYAADACIQLGKLDQAVKYLSNLQTYRKYYHKYHPNVGLQLFKLGKLELYLNNLNNAYKHLQEASDILDLTHGKDSPIAQDLQYQKVQCAEELNSISAVN